MPWLRLRLTLLQRLKPTEWQVLLMLAAGVGVLGALATLGFHHAVLLLEHALYGRHDGLVVIAASLEAPLRVLYPTAGGVAAGLVLMWARRTPRPGQGGQGGDYMEAIALGNGQLDARHAGLRALSSALTVASGGAIGREGPMVQLAALAGSLVGQWRRAPVPRRRLLVACGAAAGVATAYQAPIAGALFVAEIVLRSLAIESLGPLLVAAVAASLTTHALVGFEPVYQMPTLFLPQGSSTLVLAVLGLIAGLGAPLYLWLLDRAHAAYGRWHGPLWLKLGSGGLIVGLISVFSPEVWGNGYSVVNSVLHGGWLWHSLVMVGLLKLLAVAATTGSGAVGGIFTPTLFMGAVTGALFGQGVQALWPGLLPEPACVAIGMGAFLAASTHAPLTSVLMIFEMTEHYAIVVPSMLACVLAYSVSRVLRPASIYAAAAGGAPRTPAPALTMAADFLRPDAATLQASQGLKALEACFVRHRWPHVYVLDEARRFLGAIAMHDLAPLLRDAPADDAPWPAALLRRDYPRVALDTPVWQVLEVFATHPGERLPVLDAQGRLAGHVTKTDLVLMFRERLSASEGPACSTHWH